MVQPQHFLIQNPDHYCKEKATFNGNAMKRKAISQLDYVNNKEVWPQLSNIELSINSCRDHSFKNRNWQGATGGGGVIYDPDEFQELVYSWGLGEETNNNAEALSLWKGLGQAQKLAINEITVIGDSRILIQALVTNSLPNQMKLRQIFQKILRLSKSFRKINFFMCFDN
jgi:ribonuclease HI